MKFLIVFWLLFPGAVFSQNQEIKVFTHNIIFGGLSSGVGAVINKPVKENWKKSFVRGMWQGSIGGLLNYSAKKIIYFIDKKNNLGYAVPARILSSAGNSIIQNAAVNGPFLKNWSLEYGFLRFDFSANSEKKFRIRILPESVIATAIAIPNGRFDINTSLLTGVMAFKSKELINTTHGSHDGVNYGRAFIYTNDTSKYHLVSHEVIHEYQYREFLVFNSYLKKEVAKIKESGFKKMLTKYIYPDVPYFSFFYMLEGVESGPRYFRNYYEFEAERFATNKYVHLD